MKTNPISTDRSGRRGLLKGAVALPAAAAVAGSVAASTTRDAAPAAPASPADADAQPRGYHLSDHIRRYYALARF